MSYCCNKGGGALNLLEKDLSLSHDNRMLAVLTALRTHKSPDDDNQGRLSPSGMALIVDVYISCPLTTFAFS
jgi:hypothetical protein